MATKRTAPNARVTGQDRVKITGDIKKMYAKDKSIRAIAEETGRSYGFVHKVLAESPDVELRPRGGGRRKS